MTRLFNDPQSFAHEMIEGFAAAASRWVQPAPGGVVRATRGGEPEVALVIGGGSGHYPAFGGLVGAGLATGAAMGDLFASPSAQQVYGVVKAADQGRGVLLSYGNYAGDVLHFDQAQERLRGEGLDVRTVTVTDDIFSAPPGEEAKRRGIAGDLAVFKVAGAAAAAGYDLDGVERVARLANDRTRSFGVAFTGCTLPGADAPLFTVPEGKMAIGLGIHGEPGIDEVDIPTANELAELWVGRLLDEVPEDVAVERARVVPLVNGLGSVKYEELFVVYRRVAQLLEEAGVAMVEPEVGELCTSFDMAGASLTLLWLDDELEQLWGAPADAPGFSKGQVMGQQRAAAVTAVASETAVPQSTSESRSAAERISRALAAVSTSIDAAADELGRLDQVAGDGDHGIGMQRGAKAAAEVAAAAAEAGAGAQTTLERAADAWSDRAGGTSGALWGEILRGLGRALGDTRAVAAVDLATGVGASKDAVVSFGKAKVGDKTMVDALVPFAEEFEARIARGESLDEALRHAAGVAEEAAQETEAMVATLGRARTHGDKSIGTPDPGAVSFALICLAVYDALHNE